MGTSSFFLDFVRFVIQSTTGPVYIIIFLNPVLSCNLICIYFALRKKRESHSLGDSDCPVREGEGRSDLTARVDQKKACKRWCAPPPFGIFILAPVGMSHCSPPGHRQTLIWPQNEGEGCLCPCKSQINVVFPRSQTLVFFWKIDQLLRCAKQIQFSRLNFWNAIFHGGCDPSGGHQR